MRDGVFGDVDKTQTWGTEGQARGVVQHEARNWGGLPATYRENIAETIVAELDGETEVVIATANDDDDFELMATLEGGSVRFDSSQYSLPPAFVQKQGAVMPSVEQMQVCIKSSFLT